MLELSPENEKIEENKQSENVSLSEAIEEILDRKSSSSTSESISVEGFCFLNF